MRRLSILIDVDGWAYWRRAEALRKYSPDGWEVEVFRLSDTAGLDEALVCRPDVLLLLDYAMCREVKQRCERANFGGAFVVSFNADHRRREELFFQVGELADLVVCVNRERFDRRGRVDRCVYIPNGVDRDVFRSETPTWNRPQRALWVGSCGNREVKGYDDVILPAKPLLEKTGVECDFRLLECCRQKMDTASLVAWYNSGRYILCGSRSEGTANTVTEGVACGCLAVSAPVGNVLDWGEGGVNCEIVRRREPTEMAAAVLRASGSLRSMATAAWHAIRTWGWRERAASYYAAFDRLLSGERIRGATYLDLAKGDE